MLPSDDRLLIHIRNLTGDSGFDPKNEFIDFVEQCYALTQRMMEQRVMHKAIENRSIIDLSFTNEKHDYEKLALRTTYTFNLVALSLKKSKELDQPLSESIKRILTDYLHNTCVPMVDI